MRVLFASHSGELWGAERSLLALVRELRRGGIDGSLVCPPAGPLAEAAAISGVDVSPMTLPRLTRALSAPETVRVSLALATAVVRLASRLRKGRFDLVHANTTLAQIWSGPAALLAGIPCVWHWRDFYDIPWLHRALRRTSAARVAVSDAVHEFAAKQLGGTDDLFLIPNGVEDLWAGDGSRSRLAERDRWGIGEEHVVVAFVGQAIPRKGHEVLVRAMAHATGRAPALRAVLLSHGADEASAVHMKGVRRLVEDLGCQSCVRFADRYHDAVSLMSAADIVAVPSLREPFGRVAVEGMLAARPVVASSVDALTDIVRDGETGLLVPPGDPVALSEALSSLASRPQLRERLGAAGRERALERFSVAGMASAMLEVFSRVLARSGPA